MVRKSLLAVGVLASALTLALTAGVGCPRANAGVLWPPTERSSRLLLGGRVRCTATVRSAVQAGDAVSVKFTLHNRSKRAVKVVYLWTFSTGLVLNAADGTTYDTSAPLEALPGIPPPRARKLRGRGTLHLAPENVPVRWPGPLRITPQCLGKPLPDLRVGVVTAWPRPDTTAAVAEVVAAAGHLLDRCRPQTAGVAVDGQIDPPSGSAPPMDAECSVSLGWNGNLLVAQALVLVPPGLPGVRVFQPYETLWPVDQFLPLTSSPPYEAIAWQFVVTRDRAIPVAASSLAASEDSGRSAPFFSWDGTGWRQEGEASCGGTGFAFGGSGPDIEFISACSG